VSSEGNGHGPRRVAARVFGQPVILLSICVVVALTAVTLATLTGRRAHPEVLVDAGLQEHTDLVPVRLSVRSQAVPEPRQAVALRVLVLATGADDQVLGTWRSVLDQIGTPYDVLLTREETLTGDRLVRPDGVGRYSAVLLTSGALLHADAAGTFIASLVEEEWQALWDYERTFGVRQAALDAGPGTGREDACLRSVGQADVGAEPVPLTLTAQGAQVFDYLRPDVEIPLTMTRLNRAALVPGCDVTPLLRAGDDVAAVTSRTVDGREIAALTFVLGANQTATHLLGYGLLRWATRGVFLGEQRHWLNADIDDWFNASRVVRPDGSSYSYRLTGPEVPAIVEQQDDLRRRHPLAEGFVLNLAYNGGGLDPEAPERCSTEDTPDPLTSFSRCLRDRFRWINHTLTHPQMNDTDYDRNHDEIARNLEAGVAIGLAVPPSVLKTPEYSGLGVHSPEDDPTGRPVDHGLVGSNPALLRAARELGVEYLHGDMSYAGMRPGCFNCGVRHPLQPEVLVVPDWPTDVAFEASTPTEEIAAYAARYGGSSGNGDLTYEQVMQREADVAFAHLASGSAYTHTFHQANLRQYAPGESLVFDWLDAVLTRYSAAYAVPLQTPDWPALARYVQARTSHFETLSGDRDAVWDRAAGTVSLTPDRAGSVFLTGLATRPAGAADPEGEDAAEEYGSDAVARVGVDADQTVVLAVGADT
jgi:hypothetical protein